MDMENCLQVLVQQTAPFVTENACSCTAGNGFCQHVIALLFQIVHYKTLGLSTVPPLVSKTSVSQQWHIPPRTSGFAVRPVPNVTIQKVDIHQNATHKRARQGTRSTLYNPIKKPLCEINFTTALKPALYASDVHPQIIELWEEQPPLVNCAFGQVPKGSLLSYQAPVQVKCDQGVQHIMDGPACGSVVPPVLARNYCWVATADELDFIQGLQVSNADSAAYEKATRLQSVCPDWHALRKNRLTASNFKAVASRAKNFEVLAKRFSTRRNIQTAAMQYGVDHEDEACQAYANHLKVNIYAVGFIINPSASHLGCSPDRRVYDPSENSPWGLLEVKCPQVQCFTEATCLRCNSVGTYSLRKTHPYYFQILGQMGITGSPWCDFYLWCHNNFHVERLYFDHEAFHEMLVKLDMFFFEHLLRSIMTCQK